MPSFFSAACAGPVPSMELGHKTATMTLDQYGPLFPDNLDDVADRMDVKFRYPLDG